MSGYALAESSQILLVSVNHVRVRTGRVITNPVSLCEPCQGTHWPSHHKSSSYHMLCQQRHRLASSIRSLISPSVVCFLVSKIAWVATSKISTLASFFSWAGWFQSYLVGQVFSLHGSNLSKHTLSDLPVFIFKYHEHDKTNKMTHVPSELRSAV